MRFTNYFRKIVSKQDGSVIVIVAVCMAVFIGVLAFSLDLGLEYVQISKLQDALDCAALAAAKELPAQSTYSTGWDQARNEASVYASLNGVENTDLLNISAVYENNDTGGRIIGVTVSMTIKIHYNFAGIFGINSGYATRSSTAELVTVDSMSGLVPLCITEASMHEIQAGEVKTLKFGSQLTDGTGFYNADGWFGIIQLDGSGANDYREDFISGCTATFKVSDIIDMQCGNLSGPTAQMFSERIAGHTECTYENHESDCPRIVTIPVVTILPDKNVRITGFAGFFLLDVSGNGNNSAITAVYMGDSVLPGTASGGSAGDFGLYVAKLTN